MMRVVTEADALLRSLPQRIELDDDGVVVRAYDADDMPQLVHTVNRDLAHLRPWMPWAQQPATVETQTAWWRGTGKRRDDGSFDIAYGVFAPDGTLLGGTGFHVRGAPDVVEIGYWLAADATGRGLMTRVTAALAEVARRLDGVRRVEIKCDVANARSAAIPQRLGFRAVREETREPVAASETGRDVVWALDVD
jgi:RimJ/RimL family protein N-acetyltransferase